MKISKKIIIVAIVVCILSAIIGAFNTFHRMKREEDKTFENSDSQVNIEEKIDKYKHIENIDLNYTLENAIENNSFVINKENKIYNESILKNFISEISNSGDSTFRVTSETADSLLSVLEIQYSGDEIFVIQNNMQLSGDIIQNKYLKSDGYILKNEITTLVDETKLENYYLEKSGTKEKIELFAYIVNESKDEIQNNGNVLQ